MQHDEVDMEFLPLSLSLKPVNLVRSDWMDIEWQNMSTVFGGEKIFEDRPRAEYIIQGKVGNGYFLAALAALVEKKPHLIENMVRRVEKPS